MAAWSGVSERPKGRSARRPRERSVASNDGLGSTAEGAHCAESDATPPAGSAITENPLSLFARGPRGYLVSYSAS